MAQHQNPSDHLAPYPRRYRDLLPGAVGIAIVIAARLAGLLQPLEWAMLDTFLRLRPAEPIDKHVTIIGIDESDIQEVGTYPIPDERFARLLQQLQDYDAQVIGLDVVRDIPVEPGHNQLVEVFQTMDNVIGVETVVPDRFGAVINPPPDLPLDQIGFVDNILDADGNIRRSLLGSATSDDGYQFAMPIRLASAYLEPYGFILETGIRNPAAMRYGHIELPRISSNSGGYARAEAGGNQTLLNFRSGSQPFRRVSLTEVLEGEANPEWFRDRIVLIGVTAMSVKDIVQSSAVRSSNPGLVFGVEVQAHATSQIVNAVLEGRSLIRTWGDGWEYIWIIVWGGIGFGVSQFIQQPGRYILLVVGTSLGLIGAGFINVLSGWWIPIVPVLLVFWLNGVVLDVFYLYHRSVESRVRDRQLLIEQTFTTIHNGPLQTLAALIRKVDDATFSQEQLRQELQNLNQELRGIYETIGQEALQDDRTSALYDLKQPLHELLYQVYSDTLQRSLPYFAGLKVHVTKFEPFDERSLTSEKKRKLCRFLEEALCNVGKHAAGAKRLTVECRYNGEANVICVADNGIGITKIADPEKSSSLLAASNWGTKQAKILARQLGGTFERSPMTPKGTACELRWPPNRTLWRQLQQHVQARILAGFSAFRH